MTAIADLEIGDASSIPDAARALTVRLAARGTSDPEYWTFQGNSKRSHGHALFSYPAMMVPQLQGALLDDMVAVDPNFRSCYDPFGGSGTVLTECMRRGLDYVGSDLNPLAVLITAVKAYTPSALTLRSALDSVLTHVAKVQRVGGPLTSFRGRDKWFTPHVVADLSALRSGIAAYPGRDTRRFLWVCLAETVRLVSNSRTSTFKLHAYPEDQIQARKPQPIATFGRIAEANIKQVTDHAAELAESGHLQRGRYTGDVTLLHADVCDPKAWPTDLRADALMTSPPYGDNRTTVPYGQHAFLPLMWIDRADLPAGQLVDELLGSPYRTDVASLGGRRPADPKQVRRDLAVKSDSIARTSQALARQSGDGLDRFLSFCHDLERAIAATGPRLRPGAFQFWTLGDRRIRGHQVPTTRIVSELSKTHGAVEVTTIPRVIPRNAKRMALRNDTVATMASEDILILQSPARPGLAP